MTDARCGIEGVLAREGVWVSTTAGVSMWPMLRDRRDTIVVKPPQGRLRRFDVALYRRDGSYVLHRVVEVLPDAYVIRGDNCLADEVVPAERVVGVLTGFFRGSRAVDMQSATYRLYARLWCALHPLRRQWKRVRAAVARAVRGARASKTGRRL